MFAWNHISRNTGGLPYQVSNNSPLTGNKNPSQESQYHTTLKIRGTYRENLQQVHFTTCISNMIYIRKRDVFGD